MFIRFLRGKNGNISGGFAFALLPIMAAVATAVDYSNANRLTVQLQSALDAASLEIAINVNSGLTDDDLRALGQDVLIANLPDRALDLGDYYPTLVYLGLTVEPDGTQHLNTEVDHSYSYLLPRSIFSETSAPAKIAADARVTATTGDLACVYALNQTAARAVEAGGSTSVVMDGCIIASNSSASDSVYVGGSASVEADCVQASGGIDATSGLVTDCSANRENAWRVPDPFADLVDPVPPALLSNPKKSDTNVLPGRYSNLTLDGTKTLQPGLYYIEGELRIKGSITGAGITFFLKDGGVTANGNAALSISAPTSGTYGGMLFFASQTNTSAHSFNGNGATDLNGYLYFPKGDLTFNGNNTTTSTCLRIVADTIKLTGNSDMKSDCTAELAGREARASGPLYVSR